MAWRLHDRVVRGEIDNRQRGHVRGKIWLIGRPDPIALTAKPLLRMRMVSLEKMVRQLRPPVAMLAASFSSSGER